MKRQIVAMIVLLLWLVVRNAWGAVQYTIKDLGTLGGFGSAGADINNRGDVVGSLSFDYMTHAFLYSSGTMKDLGNFGAAGYAQATGINDSGQVVGSYDADSISGRAFLYDVNGAWKDLGTLGGSYATAYDINNSGQIVGNSIYSPNHAFLYSGNGPMQDIGTVPGDISSGAFAINNLGQIVGISRALNRNSMAFLYSGGQMKSLGSLYDLSGSVAHDINDKGQIVGEASNQNGIVHAILYNVNGPWQDLGTLPGATESYALGINNNGQIVGNARISGRTQAFLYDSSVGSMQNLNSLCVVPSGWILSSAPAINDKGQILCNGYKPSSLGIGHAFILTPIPEPSTVVLLAAGAIGFLGWAWRRRKTT